MGPETLSLTGGFPFLPGPLERSSTVSNIPVNCRNTIVMEAMFELSERRSLGSV